MKNRSIDLILPAIAIILNILLAILAVRLSLPLSKSLFNEYHIVIDVFLFFMLYIVFCGIMVRLLLKLKRLREGEYHVVGRECTYWKLVTSVTEVGGMIFLPFIPLYMKPLFFAFFGAKIGKGVEVAGKLIELPLIELGDYSFIGGNALITAHAITFDKIILKKVKIGKGATIGLGAIVLPGVKLGENSVVAAGSVVSMNTVIPPREIWGGVPARKIKDLNVTDIRG